MYKCVVEALFYADNYEFNYFKPVHLTGKWKLVRANDDEWTMSVEVEHEIKANYQEYITTGKWWFKSRKPIPRKVFKKQEWVKENNIRIIEEYTNDCGGL